MQAKLPLIQECKQCHFRTAQIPSHCPVCRHTDFGQASAAGIPAIARSALAFHAVQFVRLASLLQRIPQGEALGGMEELQLMLAESLGHYLGDPGSELDGLLQEAISAQYSHLPSLAMQAEEQGETALATQLKWMAARQGEIASALLKIKPFVETP